MAKMLKNFPHLPEIETNKSVTLPNDILKEVIRQTVIAVSKQESRPNPCRAYS